MIRIKKMKRQIKTKMMKVKRGELMCTVMMSTLIGSEKNNINLKSIKQDKIFQLQKNRTIAAKEIVLTKTITTIITAIMQLLKNLSRSWLFLRMIKRMNKR